MSTPQADPISPSSPETGSNVRRVEPRTRRGEGASSDGDPRDERITELEADLESLSHSIRSPLVALKGFAGLLEEEAGGKLGENGLHFLGRVKEAGQRIEWRLDDLGRLLEIGDGAFARQWVDPGPVLDSIGSELKELIEARDAHLVRPEDAPSIWCDRSQLRLALVHLIGNALQHGVTEKAREIRIQLASVGHATEISVADDGPGIDASLRAHAFDLFACAGERRRIFESGRESTGLGLTLARRIARAHGGSARIESTPGQGVRVTLSFPRPPGPHPR